MDLVIIRNPQTLDLSERVVIGEDQNNLARVITESQPLAWNQLRR